MGFKNRNLIDKTFLWVTLFIFSSILYTLIFCPKTSVALIYHFFFIPIYYFIATIILYILNTSLIKEKGNIIRSLLFWLFVIIITIYLKDFRRSFCIFIYKEMPFSLRGIISSGCRDMFNFLSLLTSSIIIYFILIYEFKIKKDS